jgi:hypothetical protein
MIAWIYKEDLRAGVRPADNITVAGRCGRAIIYGKSFCGLREINKYRQKNYLQLRKVQHISRRVLK